MYLNPPTNGRYELAAPLSAAPLPVDNTKWYVRTFDYQFSTDRATAPTRYAYLNRDLSFVMYPNQDFYDTKDEALDIMHQYQIKCNQESAQPQEKVYKLLEPQQYDGNQDKWMVSTTDDNYYLFSNGKIARHLFISDQLAYFPSYQSALFAKLRYERLNQCKN